MISITDFNYMNQFCLVWKGLKRYTTQPFSDEVEPILLFKICYLCYMIISNIIVKSFL